MKTTLTALLFAASIAAMAQDQPNIYQYLSEYGNPTTDSSSAHFYRTVEQTSRGFNVRDYYITGELEMTGFAMELDPKLILDGEVITYHKNGKVKERTNYHKGDRRGESKSFYEDGSNRLDLMYDENECAIYRQAWSPGGKELLFNGNGTVGTYNEKTSSWSYQTIRKSTVVDSYYVENNTDTLYTMVEKQPEYVGGYEKLSRDIRDNMIYPKSARRFGIEGTVYVQFIVNQDGTMRDGQRVLRGIQSECDAAAIAAVKSLKKWTPGYTVDEKAVNVLFVLPVKFKLK